MTHFSKVRRATVSTDCFYIYIVPICLPKQTKLLYPSLLWVGSPADLLRLKCSVLQKGNHGTAWFILMLSLGSAGCTSVGTNQLQQRLECSIISQNKTFCKTKQLNVSVPEKLSFLIKVYTNFRILIWEYCTVKNSLHSFPCLVVNAAGVCMTVSVSSQTAIFSLVAVCSVFRLTYVLRADKNFEQLVQGFLHLSRVTWAFMTN